MMIRRLLLVLFICCGPTAGAQMLSDVRVQPTETTVAVGETVTLRAIGSAGCCSNFPWRALFFSSSPGIAFVDGILQAPAFASDIAIMGITPGTAYVVSNYKGNGTIPLARIDVTCPATTAVTPASPIVTKQVTPAPVRLAVDAQPVVGWTFTWYRGNLGDTSSPIPAGDTRTEITFTPDRTGTHHVWVQASGSCASATVEFTVIVNPRRRAARR